MNDNRSMLKNADLLYKNQSSSTISDSMVRANIEQPRNPNFRQYQENARRFGQKTLDKELVETKTVQVSSYNKPTMESKKNVLIIILMVLLILSFLCNVILLFRD